MNFSLISYAKKLSLSTLNRALILFLVVIIASCSAPAPSGEDERIDVVKSLYAAFGEGDMATVESLIDDGIVWTYYAQENVVPYAGNFIGWSGVQDFFAKFSKNVEMQAFEPESFSVSGDIVYVTGTEQGMVRQTGGHYQIKWVQLYTVENGRITRMEEFADTGALSDAFTPADAKRGQAYYTSCAGCHGLNAEGLFGMHAPNLTMLDSSYLLRQLHNFRDIKRAGPADFYGWMMNGRAKALPGDRAVRDVVAYIQTLPEVANPNFSDGAARVAGDKQNGEAIFSQNCVACHGEKAEGNPTLNSPNISGLQDWYLLEQLTKFRSGLRGTNKEDIHGQQMRPSALALEDDAAVKDVVAYIATLKAD